MTHISAADGARAASTHDQQRLVEKVLRDGRQEGLLSGWIHMANSAAVFTDLRPRYDTVRPGISAYGVMPSDMPGSDELKPAMSLLSQIVFLKDIPSGYPVGYSSTWHSEHPTRIATVPVGYNHPKLKDPAFLEELQRAALTKPANSDIYTEEMARFVETFARVAVPESHAAHLFFVEGGSVGEVPDLRRS